MTNWMTEVENKLLKLLLQENYDEKTFQRAFSILTEHPSLFKGALLLKCHITNFTFQVGALPEDVVAPFELAEPQRLPQAQQKAWWLIPLKVESLTGVLGLLHDASFTKSLEDKSKNLKRIFEMLAVAFFRQKNAFCMDQKFFNRLTRATQDILLIHNMDGKIEFVNEAALKVSGYAYDELIGQPIARFLPAEELQSMQERFERRKAGDTEKFFYETRFKTADGRIIPVEVGALPIKEENTIKHLIIVARDISDKKQLISSLEAQKQNLEITLKSIGDGVITTDRSLKITFLNDRILQILGGPAQHYLGKSITDILPLKGLNGKTLDLNVLIQNVLTSGTTYHLDEPLEFFNEQNKRHIITASISAIKQPQDGQVLGLVFVVRDHTEQFALQTRLRYSEQQLENLMNNLPGVIYRCLNDHKFTLTFLSKGIVALTGYSANEILEDKNFKYSELILPSDRKIRKKAIKQALEQKKPFQCVYKIKTKDGKVKWIWEQGRLIQDQDGTELLEGYLADITEKQKAQEEVAHLNRILFVIRNINQLIVREKNETQLLTKSCRLIAESGDFNFAWIVKLDESLNVELIYSDRNQPVPFVKDLVTNWINETIQQKKIIQFYETEKPINNSQHFVVALIRHGNQIYGGLVVGLASALSFSNEEIELFIEMSADIGYAIHMNRLEAQSLIVKNSIEVINKKLKGSSSAEILQSLVKNIAKVLDTEYAIIGKLSTSNKRMIETLVVFEHGELKENFSYDLKDTPSEKILKYGTHSFKKDVCNVFKNDALLKQKGANGYLGTPIYSTEGKKLGVFITFSKKEMPLAPQLQNILEFFAQRIGLEIQRMEAEARLSESERKYRNIFENTPFGIYQTSLDGYVLEANPALLKMLGYKSLKDLKKRNIEKEGYLVPDGRKRFLEKVLNAEDFIVHEDIWLRKDGSPIYIREKARVIRDQAGRPLYIEGTVEDISDRKAKEEEILYQSQLLAAAQDPIIATDLDFRITYWNRSAEEFYGFKEAEVKGKRIEKIVKLNISHKERMEIRQQVMERGSWRGEIEQIKKNGERVFVDMSISLLYDSEGKPQAIVGINRDISDKVRYREAIKASEESYRGLYNAVEEAIYIQNPDGTFLDVNDGAVKMYGYPRSYFIGKNPVDLSAPGKNDMELVFKKFKKALKGEPQMFEFWGKRANGEIFPKIVRLYKGNYFGKDVVIALALDVTEEKKAEEELRKLTAAVEQSPNSILITDVEGNIEYVNNKFCEVSGYSKEEVLGQNPRLLKSGNMPAEIYQELWETIKSGKVWHGELQNKRKNGKLYWEDVIISPLFNDKGEITQFLGLKQDITAQKELEEEKKRLEKQLHQNQRLETIGTLAGGIAHDFNNILTPILGYAEMIKLANTHNPQLQNKAEQIIKAALRARDLIQQILTFSRQVEHEQKPVYLQNIVNEAYHLLRASIPSTIELVRNIDKNCKPVLGDPAKLHQVLMNLCTNAYQAMEESGGKLTIELKTVVPDDRLIREYPALYKKPYVCLTVSDTGVGMEPETLERIFEPFFTTKGVGKGTGLGLSVVHGIVKNYQGEIIVKSQKGKGSSFSIYLPAAEAEKPESQYTDAIIPTGSETILLVDDEPSVLELQKRILEHFGYQVKAFNNPLEALAFFKQKQIQFDLLITDLTMPNLTGIELAQKINQIDNTLPIILITGYSEELTPTLKEKYGIKEILMKPVVAAQMAQTIRKVFEDRFKH